MTQVLDYSAGFPGARAIRDAGYAGAVCYIGFPDRRKCATAGELADFTANAIGMALVHENTITDWRGGYGAGRSAAQRARNHANAIGFPSGRPIYMAVDQDVVWGGEFDVMLDYLRGAGSVLGAGLNGLYGEADAIDRAREAGVAKFFWQTAAWSRRRHTTAHLYQHVGTVYVGGIACDVNDVLAADWGQHNVSPAAKQKLKPKEEDAMIIQADGRGQALVVGSIVVALGADSAGPRNSGETFPRVTLSPDEYDRVFRQSEALQSLPGKLDALLAKESTGGGGVSLAGTYNAAGSITLTPEGQ